MNEDDRCFDPVDDAFRDKYFSHAYVECGFLDSPLPSYTRHWASNPDETIYDLASLSKGLCTAPLVYNMLGKKGLSTCLGDYISGLPGDVSSLTIISLLGHVSGLEAWRNFWINRLNSETSLEDYGFDAKEHILEVFRRSDCMSKERKERYSDLGFILLGLMLEESCQGSLDNQFYDFQKNVLSLENPLLVYGNRVPKSQAIVSSYCKLRDRNLKGEVHDENCYSLGGISGHAGLFSTGPQLGQYLRRFHQSELGKDFIRANYEASLAGDTMLGLRKGDDPSSEVFGNGKAIGHLGFTGTAFWLDCDRKSYGIFLSNRIVSGRISGRIKTLRADVFKGLQRIVEGLQA